MQVKELKQKVRFGTYEADFAEGELRKSGTRLRIQSKPLAVLRVLVETPGEIVSRETLRSRLWTEDNVFVDFDKNLSTAVNKLREALCDSAEKPRYIETVPKRGYRFLPSVEHVLWVPATRLEAPEPHSAPVAVQPLSKKRRRWLMPLALVLCLTGLSFAWFAVQSRKSVQQDPAPTIAVLPFTNRSAGSEDGYFADGLSEEIVTNLGRIPGLRVIGRNSSFQFKAGTADTREVGKRLGVMYLVEGSVQKVGGRIRIEAELVNASDGFQMWTDSYETTVDDVLRVEDEISRAVTSALSTRLLGETGAGSNAPRVNPEAYQAYLQARYFKERWIVSELSSSLAFLNRSLQIDPSYAPAWALRSSVFASMGDMGVLELSQAMQKARQDAERSIALDPNYPDGYIALATVLINSWDWGGAETALAKASELAPRDPKVLVARSQLYRALGQLDNCITTLRKVTLLDPLSPSAYGMLGNRMYYAGRYEEGLSAQQRALELNPQAEFVHLNRGEVYLALRRPQEALREIEQEPGALWSLLGKALVQHDLGNDQESDAAVQQLAAKYGNEEAYIVAEAYAYRGEIETAFTWLDRAVDQHDSSLIDLKVDPLVNNLRRDARFTQIVKKVGLPGGD